MVYRGKTSSGDVELIHARREISGCTFTAAINSTSQNSVTRIQAVYLVHETPSKLEGDNYTYCDCIDDMRVFAAKDSEEISKHAHPLK